jgi:DNA-binding FrmR family transcriptional regulator
LTRQKSYFTINIPYRGIVLENRKEEDRMDIENNNQCSECSKRMTSREQKLKSSLITRLNRVEGQVRGIKGMIEKDQYCDDVLNQIAAAQAALNSISKLVLENHIRGCLVEKIRNGNNEIVDELLVTIGKLL